ncbi:MAG: hypothetical protein KFF72_09320 [Arthrospira sp. SH-MAG29]|nr:hypothetical protein [Arthrospira sp. SH-MAG29]MBS0016539.1 hypothetical protein [Arthrospira sp. SH-MAG29]
MGRRGVDHGGDDTLFVIVRLFKAATRPRENCLTSLCLLDYPLQRRRPVREDVNFLKLSSFSELILAKVETSFLKK